MIRTVAIAAAICATLYGDSGSNSPVPRRTAPVEIRAAPQDYARQQPRAMPSTATVSFRGGLLTIVARDVRLRDILDQVHEATGAEVLAPALNELVTAHLGPRPPAEVIAALLNRVHPSYVIVDAAGSGNIQAIELMQEPPAGSGRGSRQPEAAAQTAAFTQTDAAREKALLIGQTGGDEGVWDNVDVGTLIDPGPSTAAAVLRPVQAVPATSIGQK